MFVARRCSRFLRYLAVIILFSTANVPGKKDAVSGKDAKEKVRRHTQKMTFFTIKSIGCMPLFP